MSEDTADILEYLNRRGEAFRFWHQYGKDSFAKRLASVFGVNVRRIKRWMDETDFEIEEDDSFASIVEAYDADVREGWFE